MKKGNKTNKINWTRFAKKTEYGGFVRSSAKLVHKNWKNQMKKNHEKPMI